MYSQQEEFCHWTTPQPGDLTLKVWFGRNSTSWLSSYWISRAEIIRLLITREVGKYPLLCSHLPAQHAVHTAQKANPEGAWVKGSKAQAATEQSSVCLLVTAQGSRGDLGPKRGPELGYNEVRILKYQAALTQMCSLPLHPPHLFFQSVYMFQLRGVLQGVPWRHWTQTPGK